MRIIAARVVRNVEAGKCVQRAPAMPSIMMATVLMPTWIATTAILRSIPVRQNSVTASTTIATHKLTKVFPTLGKHVFPEPVCVKEQVSLFAHQVEPLHNAVLLQGLP